MLRFRSVFSSVALSLVLACGSDGPKGSQGPQGEVGPGIPMISMIWADQNPIEPGGEAAVQVSASHPGSELTYTWSVSPGWTVVAGQYSVAVTVQAPDTYASSGTATVIVSDARGNQAQGALVLSTLGNSKPQIRSVAVWPQPVEQTATLWADAADDFSATLDYRWFIGGVKVAMGKEATWHSPGLAGSYVGTVTVTDEAGEKSKVEFPIVAKGVHPHAVGRGDVQRTGRSPYAALATGAVLWATPLTGGTQFSDPVIGANGLLYVGTIGGALVALHALRGEVVWTYDTGGPVKATPVLRPDGTVLVATSKGKLAAVDAATGQEKWATGEEFLEFFGSPVVGADGTIYVGNRNFNLYAFSPNGTVKWVYETQKDIYNSPALAPDGTVYVASYDQFLHAVSPEGRVVWSRPLLASSRLGLAVGSSGTIYVSTAKREVLAFSPVGELMWQRRYRLQPMPAWRLDRTKPSMRRKTPVGSPRSIARARCFGRSS